ncbi:hypothetical protein GCM10011352_36390 [Marinobacterium zhoushanense]|uniref:Glycosyl transferase family 1 n=2 Tax=Marinobacterium zhoushanense TaxID=1679163 RepID=A0ABQ1KPJ5_9GAMM|nr:hypothetical protein GCM10011352_36390 [Marinobacterium zhoushanense]
MADYFVMFGSIARYKNISDVIRNWNSCKKLVIAGRCDEIGYLNELQDLAKGKNVEIVNRFLDKIEAQELVSKSSGLILAQVDKEMIVSGSFFYAASLGVPVIAIETPFLLWLSTEIGFDGLTTYKTIGELVESVSKNISSQLASREAIRNRANELFGDSAVKNVWQTILGNVEK